MISKIRPYFHPAYTDVPASQGIQAWDRYAYTLNNPLRYVDPSGHLPDQQNNPCIDGHCGLRPQINPFTFLKNSILHQFGITISDKGKAWDLRNLRVVYNSLCRINMALGGKAYSLVRGATFKLAEYTKDTGEYYGLTEGTTVTFFTKVGAAIRQMNIYHEFGHVVNSLPGLDNILSNALDNLANPSFILTDGEDAGQLDPGALKAVTVYDPNYPQGADAYQNPSTDSKEQWADIFANYVAGNINLAKSQGEAMYDFVTGALAPYIGLP